MTTLRAFEAAARLGGFAAAAVELGVTPGAVTAHIKTLEDYLGAGLFDRHPRGVVLSPLGQRVLPTLTEAFDHLGLAVQTLRFEAAPRDVHIVTLPAIAELWLSPKLPALRAALPGVSISITAMETMPELKRVPFDLSLFFGPVGQGRKIADDEIFPVCAPAIANHLRRPQDLAGVPCLTDSAWADDWQSWAALAMPGQRFSPRGPVFSLYALAVREAIQGAGVLIGHRALVADALAAGTLVMPFDISVTLPRILAMRAIRSPRQGSAAAKVAGLLLAG